MKPPKAGVPKEQKVRDGENDGSAPRWLFLTIPVTGIWLLLLIRSREDWNNTKTWLLPVIKSWKFWAVMGVLAALVAMFTYGFTTDPKLVPSPLVGKPAPAFGVAQLNGTGRVSLADLKGTPVILNFWASWCVACREEAGVLEAAHLKFEQGEHRVRVIGIAIQDTPDQALAFAKRFGKTYFLALDNAKGDIGLSYGLYGVPETFFIDAGGIIVCKKIGPVTPQWIEERVQQPVCPEGSS
jgi:cytochrome c biogenesis protein CcmG/thiol:disulfide interchange protein DsbE